MIGVKHFRFAICLVLAFGAFLSASNADEQCIDQPDCNEQTNHDWASIYVDDIDWHPDGELFTVGGSFGVQLYNTELDLIQEQTYPSEVLALSWKPDGSWLAIATDKQIYIWDENSETLIQIFEDSTDPLAWHPTLPQLAFPNKQLTTIYVWDFDNSELIHIIPTEAEGMLPILDWNYNGDGLQFIAMFELYLWNRVTNQLTQIEALPFHNNWGQWWGNVWDVDKDRLITSPLDPPEFSPYEIVVWNYVSGSYAINTHPISPVSYMAISWSPDGKYIAIADNTNLAILDAETLDTWVVYSLVDKSDYMWRRINQCPESVKEGQMRSHIAWHPDSESVLLANPCSLTIIPIDE
jgi:WD40 repeat protein